MVLESARIGWGASGRNGGQMVNSYSHDLLLGEAAAFGSLGGRIYEQSQVTEVEPGDTVKLHTSLGSIDKASASAPDHRATSLESFAH